MNIWMLLIISAILLWMAGYAFYIAFKRYEDDDDFMGGVGSFTFIEIIFGIILFVTEKFAPKKYHIFIFKASSVLFGLFMLGLIALMWRLFF